MDVDLTKLFDNSITPAPLNLKKYLDYVLKNKYWIIVSALLFAIIIGFAVPIYLEKNKKYTTSSVIRVSAL